ncbi:hypothetical protein SAMN04488037_102420 [Shimia marina]|uniref:Uncharacterized protein n=1 Tax=Shimia marina TaxID=321267 RepID=A0A0P1ET63_9RHOB|nr:hypothetical protein SHM7688_02852 [Shimia marina]SFD77942.1 hypothetical protein SAMN04488037_102420 [Shimia marina]
MLRFRDLDLPLGRRTRARFWVLPRQKITRVPRQGQLLELGRQHALRCILCNCASSEI